MKTSRRKVFGISFGADGEPTGWAFMPKRRALYRYTCKECQKPRASLVYGRAVRGICHLHRVTKVNPNQQTLFPVDKMLLPYKPNLVDALIQPDEATR